MEKSADNCTTPSPDFAHYSIVFLVLRVFLTYGSEGNYLDAAKRLASQAECSKLFHKIEIFDDSRLLSESEKWHLWSRDLCSQDRSDRYKQAGKAFLLLWATNRFKSTEALLFYADPGCEIPSNFISRFRMRRLFANARKFGGLAEALDYPEKQFTHLKMLELMDPERLFWESGQVQNTFFVLYLNDKSCNFAESWVELINPQLGLWKDPEIDERQLSCFVAHRRDQSLFSILWKQKCFATKRPYWEHGGILGNIRGIALPILTIRNRTGKSRLPSFQNSSFIALIGICFSLISDVTRRFRKMSNAVIKKYIWLSK